MTQYGDQPWDSEPTRAAPAAYPQPEAYPPPAQPVGYGSPYGYAPAGYGAAAPPSSPGAITVMVLGIVSVVSVALCPVVGLVPAIIALVMAGKTAREIEESHGQFSGLGMVTAGRILSWITIGLHVLGIVVFVLFFFVISAASTV